MITLEYNGTELALADWGFAQDSAEAEHVNLSASRYALDLPGASISSTPAIPFRGKVILRRQRTWNAISEEYENGYVAFIGYRTRCSAYTNAVAEGVTYSFENAWHFLENTPYQQNYATFNTVNLTMQFKPVSELLLFTELDGSNILQPIDAGEQIGNIMQFVIDTFLAQGMAQPFIIGTIDPDIPFPSYQAREMLCAAAILKCLELSPDVVSWFDYTTELAGVPTPTIHFYNRASRTAKSLAIKNGTDHASLAIVPREDLIPRAVIITYKLSGTNEGKNWIIYAIDKYGPNGQGHASDPDGGLDVLLQTIELLGYQSESASLLAESVDCNAASQADRKTWWSKTHPMFEGTKLRNVVFGDATIKDKDGNTVSLATYPNRLLPKSPPLLPWMATGGGSVPLVGEFVKIECMVTYDEYDVEGTSGTPETDTNGNKIKGKLKQKINTTAIVTNGTTGVYNTTVSGEAIPGFVEWDEAGDAVFANGIAAKVYTALATLQYQGVDIRVQAEITNATNDGPFITLAHSLNLTGGLAAWASMAAQIQRITEHDGTGAVTISFGPARHISSGDWAAMFQFNRLRRIWYSNALRQTADLSSQSRTPDKTAAENSIAAFTEAEFDATVFRFSE